MEKIKSPTVSVNSLIGSNLENFEKLGRLDQDTYKCSINHIEHLISTPWKSADKLLLDTLRLLLKMGKNFFPGFVKKVDAYLSGLGTTFEEIALPYLIPDIISTAASWMPCLPTSVFGCSSFFMLNNKKEPIHGRILDFPLLNSFDNNENITIHKVKGHPTIFSYSSSGMCFPAITAINDQKITVALHQKFTNLFNPKGTPIFEIVHELLLNCDNLSSALQFLKAQSSIGTWGLYIGFPTGEVLSYNLLGKDSSFNVYNLEEKNILYFSNFIEGKENDFQNIIPFGIEHFSNMRTKGAKQIIKTFIKNDDFSDQALLKSISKPLIQKCESAKKWHLYPANPSSLSISVLNGTDNSSLMIPGVAPKFYKDQIVKLSNIFSDITQNKIEDNGKKEASTYHEGIRNLMLAQVAMDQKDTHVAYHNIQMSINQLNGYPEKQIATFYFSVFRFIHETHKETRKKILDNFIKNKNCLPEYLNDHCLLFIFRLEKILGLSSSIKKMDIKNSKLRKMFMLEQKIPGILLHKMISTFMKPRIEILDILYGHLK